MTDASSIDSFLQKQGSPMAGLGNVFVAAGQKYKIDPALLVGIAGAESSFGKYLFRPHNAWGWGGKTFSNWPEAISTVASGLRSGYANEGRLAPSQIVSKYAPASDGNDEHQWASNVESFMRELGSTPASSSTVAPPVDALPTAGSPAALPGAPRSMQSLAAPTIRQTILSSAGLDPQTQVRRLVNTMIGITPTSGFKIPRFEQPGMPTGPTGGTPVSGPANPSRWAKVAAGANRAGVPIHQSVVNAVARIGQAWGSPLTINYGTNHNQYVQGTHRQSQHWTGDAADVDFGHGTGSSNIDPQLTKLGQTALMVAGMPRAEALKQTGGAFNVGGWNILFNTYIGGNHYNHLHVGV